MPSDPLQLLTDYNDYLGKTAHWKKLAHATRRRANPANLEAMRKLAEWCAEFLIHGVDVEGQCRGIDQELVSILGQWSPIATTYAGGASSLADLEAVTRLGQGRIDLTIGSALDIFGGSGVRYEDAVAFNRQLGLDFRL